MAVRLAVPQSLPLPLASPPAAGIGLRQPHYAQVIEQRPALGFVEVHSENFFADGGAALAVLQQVRQQYEVSLHGVGLGLGSAAGIDAWHLDRLARLCECTEPTRVSDHACFARVQRAPGQAVVHGSDLLPIAFTHASLDILCRNVQQVQDRLKRRLLVENLSAYLVFAQADWEEPDFLAELCRRTGCGLLLDVNNLMVNALNEPEPHGVDGAPSAPGAGASGAHTASSAQPGPPSITSHTEAIALCGHFIDRLPRHGVVGEIHVAGYCDLRQLPAAGGPPLDTLPWVIDDHGSRVRPEVWAVYAHALRRFGAVPSLVEWDTDLPDLAVLLDEAATADAHARQVAAEAPR